jgi:hypothetical protein
MYVCVYVCCLLDGLSLLAALEEVQGGEALHGQTRHIDLVSRAVHLGDDDTGAGLFQLGAQGVQGGSEL